MRMKLANALAGALVALHNCEQSGNEEWRDIHRDRIKWLAKNYLPSGAGVDSGCTVHDEDSDGYERIVISTSFHHMDDNGCYSGWTEHQVIVTANLIGGFGLQITGKNRNDIKLYLSELFHSALSAEVDEYPADMAYGDRTPNGPEVEGD